MKDILGWKKISCKALVDETVSVEQTINSLKTWVESQAKKYKDLNLVWFLAHTDEGVIFGKIDDNSNKLITADSLENTNVRWIAPKLRIETLQQARLFGVKGELFLWRDGNNHWKARLIREAKQDEEPFWEDAIEESQMMLGTHGTHGKPLKGFTLLEDGAQGLPYAFPASLHLDEKQKVLSPKLVVLHYINKIGFARIVASRLAGLVFEGENNG